MPDKKSSIVPGALMIIVGGLLLLHRLDLIYLRWRDTYPLIMLGLSVWLFISAFSKEDKGQVFPATILLILGAFFFMRNFNLFLFDYYFYDWEDAWPIFLVAVGAGFVTLFIFKPDDWGVLIPGGILLGLGVVFFLRNFGFFYWFDFANFWPVILIAIGVFLVLSGMNKKPKTG